MERQLVVEILLDPLRSQDGAKLRAKRMTPA